MAQQHKSTATADGSGDNSDNNDKTIDIAVHCLCKAHAFTAPSIPVSSLPLKATSCHCNSCRYTTGALYSADIEWPGNPAEVHDSDLKRFIFTDRVTVMFCGTCGSPMFFEEAAAPGRGHKGKAYSVFTGALPNVKVPGSKPLIAFEHHMFLCDTKDGGASPWLKDLDYDTQGDCARATRRWLGNKLGSEEIPGGQDWPALSDLSAALDVQPQDSVSDRQEEEQTSITIPVKCKCGGVHFDLLASMARREFAQMSRDKLPRFVDPDNNKSLASFDACDSCRVSSGLDIFHWTFYWLKHIAFPRAGGSDNDSARQTLPASTKELQKAVLAAAGQRDQRLGTLKMYASSPDVQRYFCGQCSAVVFYACDDLSDQVDVALGLLRAPSAGATSTENGGSEPGHGGARAEHLVSWKLGGTMAWQQDVKGGWREPMMQHVSNQAAAWRDRRGLAKNWRVRNDEKEAAGKAAST